MVMKRWIMGALLVLGLVMGSLGTVQAAGDKDEPATCGMCGKEMTNAHVGFILTHPDGKEERFGCAGCGLSILKDMKAVKDAKPRTLDFLRGDEIDARAAYYVRGSSFNACCEPSFLAFAKKDEAERFAKGFGGKVLDFESAFQAVHAAHHHGK
jgi:hypothetical protein